ncbi:MAG TPA: zinc-dependent alcohol dehydrogenase family protein [Methylomirabilota bacterium]|jgi:propanol-preferring alcohol dehydrogenase
MVVRAQGPIESRPLVAEERPRPVPGPHEILVRVAACGVCRTDLHVAEGDLPLRGPVVPGHQIVGRIEERGAGATRFAPGDRVGIAWLRWTCGTCEFCTSGRENLCRGAKFTGWSADGGFATYAIVHEQWAYRIPDVFDDVEAAPLLCAGIIGYRALRLASVPRTGRLGIYGFGSSAHLTLQVALARGATVYVCTRGAAGQARARTLGAAWAGDVGSAMPHATDGTIIFAPAGELVPRALENLAAGGTLVLAGIYMTPFPSMPYELVFQERMIRSVTANTRADGVALLHEAASIPLRPEIRSFALADANEALALLKQGAFRGTAVLVP